MKEEEIKYLQRWQAECSRRELCEAQIRRKLAGYGNAGLSVEAGDEIIERLKKDKFLDDNRFAAAYIKDKTTFSGWGLKKVETELLKRGVLRPVVSKAIERYLREEQGAEKQQQALERIAAQKWESIVTEAKRRDNGEIQPAKLKAKLVRFLVGRGYGYDAAYSAAVKRCDESL